MPNQQLGGPGSVLTLGLANELYVQRSSGSGDSLAIGLAAVAGGANSVALGAYSLGRRAQLHGPELWLDSQRQLILPRF